MRNWIIGAAAVIALAVPGVAAAQTGYVGAVYSNADVEGADEADAWGLEGAVAFAGSGSIVFEVDAGYTSGDDVDTTGLTGHVYTRNDSHLFGAFVGLSDSDATDTTWTVGVEASKFYTDWTLAGAVFYANNDDNDVDGYGINTQARYFVNDNFRLQGNLGWATVDTGADDDDAFTYGVGGEYQFAAAPISIAAGYNRVDSDAAEADVLSLAVRYNWGGTLRDRDRSGASQADITGLGFLL
ncbi:MAG: hypothetical protein J0L81_08100 [Caulobacterales bacterium]|jgi:hypothetical protein|nr:hypothetical protein [Caulobacterales bacterium]